MADDAFDYWIVNLLVMGSTTTRPYGRSCFSVILKEGKMRRKTEEAIETLLNGNISDFRKWLKRCSKLDMLNAIEYYTDAFENQSSWIVAKMVVLLRKEK